MHQMSKFAHDTMLSRYAHDIAGGKETWPMIARRTVENVMSAVPHHVSRGDVNDLIDLVERRVFMPGGRYLYASGRPYHQTQNCLLLRAEDTREGWARHLSHVMSALMTGAGVGAVYSGLREEDAPLGRGGGRSSGPLALMQVTNECGRGARQGGARRGAIWAGLNWKHKDVFKFITAKQWSPEVRALKAINFDFPATLDFTNISVCLDDAFFTAYHDVNNTDHAHARAVYWAVVRGMLKHAEPGFSVDVGENAGEDLRNACTEITSADDNDICNLGSINMARIKSLDEMRTAVELGTMFLLAGTVYSDVPYPEVAVTREKNRRLGLGLMGLHEWLLRNGESYAPSNDLAKYLDVYRNGSRADANYWSAKWDLSNPVKVRAIAPNGTIGIVAETTTSAEPVFCRAYKRRYRQNDEWLYQYVIDPTAERLIKEGIDPDKIEDAYSIPAERRIGFQAWLQSWVDHGISSTINLPAWGSPNNNETTVESFGNTLLTKLPKLRGITAYPDGAIGGQPLNVVDYSEAIKHVGEVLTEGVDICDITKGGSCGN